MTHIPVHLGAVSNDSLPIEIPLSPELVNPEGSNESSNFSDDESDSSSSSSSSGTGGYTAFFGKIKKQ